MTRVERGTDAGLPWVSNDAFPDVDFYSIGNDQIEVVSQDGLSTRTFSLEDVVNSLRETADALIEQNSEKVDK